MLPESGLALERVKTAKHYWAVTWAPIVFGIVALIYASIYFSTPDVHFRSSDSGWADYEINFRDRNFRRIVYNFEGYKLICKKPDVVLLRTTHKNWFNIFAWPNYWQDRKWLVPYAAPDPGIGKFFPHPEDDKHCYNDEWKEELLDQARKNMQAHLKRIEAAASPH